ncbi:hypothetical protein GPX89_07555 [Nocardia sp. ET3-3]|uniref:Uncharacterized protein n=1 Tax=Nocardia terrae TaxID=2675851 RepID=A0A7K1URX3_9NOCA|nr:hypothetical protein [Nocardia terrae]MVU77102.1 hypothetical protein [Nocardia terrae]
MDKAFVDHVAHARAVLEQARAMSLRARQSSRAAAEYARHAREYVVMAESVTLAALERQRQRRGWG